MPARQENADGTERSYRAYEIDPLNRIVGFRIVTAGSDQEAIAQALATAGEHPVELWDRGRLLIRIPREG